VGSGSREDAKASGLIERKTAGETLKGVSPAGCFFDWNQEASCAYCFVITTLNPPLLSL
jgi:hypothetical protein